MNEQIAKLEAKLRGGKAFAFVGRRGTPPQIGIQVGTEQFPPTDPATPEGREWWCEVLRLHVEPLEAGRWAVWRTSDGVFGISVDVEGESRTDTIIKAIEAAALAGAPTPEQQRERSG